MTTDSAPRIKITYATLSADNEELHARVRGGRRRGTGEASAGTTSNYIDGAWRDGDGTFEVRSPIDRDIVLGTFARGTAADVDDAVAAARAAQPAWAAVPWRERLAIVTRAGDLISDRLMEYSADMAIEVGKNRIEALGEVEESADLLRYYAQTMEDNDGYDHAMGNLGDAAVHTRSILRPHGVFAVISPFNFPMALATGPTGAALHGRQHGRAQAVVGVAAVGGRTCIKALHRCRRPEGRRQPRHGPGRDGRPGAPGPPGHRWHRLHRLVRGRDGAVPRRSRRRGRARCIVEMGGKNPAIVSRNADLEEAAEGIMRSAFGFGGQKCSANSRVYVERPVHDELVRLLVEKTEKVDDRRPARPRELAGPDHRPAGGRPAPDRGRRGAPRRDRVHRRRAPDRRRPGARLLRRADRRRRPADLAPAVPRRAVRAVHRGRRGRLDGRGAGPGERQRARA